ncbi:MAG TPA: DEAD/DEAH box helicase family protein [Solirubrobacteraceae bacterium]|nr:DEAD/DEAH box helicase family protein [Solirubrobacteraceae bacterium]
MSVTTTERPGTGGGSGLRGWQQRALAAMDLWDGGSFLISAAPGAGKTRPALEFARRELAKRAVDGVVVTCPTAPLTRQWARAAHALGLELAPDADSPRPPRGFHGVVVTYARIVNSPRVWAGGTRERTLIIADEAHHLGEELAWGVGFGEAFAAASRWLLLSGTPFRSDATPIPGVEYDANGLAEPDVSYSYADAVRDKVCRPVVFVTYDGTLSWRSGDDVIETGFDTVLTSREASRRYRTAISTDLPDGLPRILGEADVRLRALRAGGHPEAGGLVVAADSEHARKIAARLREVSGASPVVVLHQDPRAAAKLADFTSSADPWIVAVNMVSEGVDIPRLRVGVYATAAKTPLIFRQIVGRFVRTIQGREPEPSWLYIPADTILRDHAAAVETELRYLVRQRAQDDDLAELDELERRQTEKGEVLDFEPLSADVAPQMTLFGPAPSAPAPVITRVPEPMPMPLPAAEVEESVPLFERRAQLRAKRHKLVAELARDRRTRHSDVNAEVNRAIGIAAVPKATIEQLERSIEWLDRVLYGR